MAWKREEAVDAEAIWDMVEVTAVEKSKMICLQVRVGTRKVERWSTVYRLEPGSRSVIADALHAQAAAVLDAQV
jgi:hypothetical protein